MLKVLKRTITFYLQPIQVMTKEKWIKECSSELVEQYVLTWEETPERYEKIVESFCDIINKHQPKTYEQWLENMQKNYDKLVESHNDIFDEFEAGIRHWYSMAIKDLQSLSDRTVTPKAFLLPKNETDEKTR